MKEKIVDRLVSIKSIVTLTMTLAYVYLGITGVIDADKIDRLFLIIIGFYFGTQHEKKIAQENDE